MATLKRRDTQLLNPGPYVGIVKGTADVNRMGRLDVYIPELQDVWTEETGKVPLLENTITVNYCSPFAGQTPYVDAKGQTGFAETQKSYGFWMVPPDVETRVLVIFANNNINEGYWIGCIPDFGMNHMVPGIATQDASRVLGDDDKDYYVKDLKLSDIPAAEANRKSEESFIKTNTGYDVDRSAGQRPVHTYHADELVKQGLIEDNIRGTTTSSARRETPSQVFGISTPGPIDPKGQSAPARESANRHGLTQDGSKVSHSRLGGHQFVMDDGTPPKHDGVKFTTDIENELVRIRTRSGAQILLHNSEDLVYIINNSGDAWIELSKGGKIDVYANDSVSMHTNSDFNLRAERDINIESGRNINLKATGQNKEEQLINSDKEAITGRIHIDASDNIEMISAKSVEIKAGEDMEVFTVKDFAVKSEEQTIIEAQKDLRVMTREDLLLFATDSANIEIGSSAGDSTGIGNVNVFVKNDIDMTVGRTVRKHITTDNILSVGTDNKVFAGNDHLVNTGNEIHFNTSGKVTSSVYATAQRPAADLVGDLGERVPVDVVVPLTTFTNKITPENKAPYGERESIMKRVPTAEPYEEHENKKRGIEVDFTAPKYTDRETDDNRDAKSDIGGDRYSGKGPEA